jgi:hypothetical protein
MHIKISISLAQYCSRYEPLQVQIILNKASLNIKNQSKTFFCLYRSVPPYVNESKGRTITLFAGIVCFGRVTLILAKILKKLFFSDHADHIAYNGRNSSNNYPIRSIEVPIG